MTDQAGTEETLEVPDEDISLEAAKEAAAVPPEVIPDAADLPDEVRDGDISAADVEDL